MTTIEAPSTTSVGARLLVETVLEGARRVVREDTYRAITICDVALSTDRFDVHLFDDGRGPWLRVLFDLSYARITAMVPAVNQ